MVGSTAKTTNLQQYRWDADQGISTVDILAAKKRNPVAYIYAPDTQNDPEQQLRLQSLEQQLGAQGWTTSPGSRDGKAVLRVTGFENSEALIALLGAQGHVSGPANVTTQSAKPEKKSRNPIEIIRANTLRGSGVFYMMGNILMILSGVKRGNDLAQMGTGISFAAGDAMLAAFSGHNEARQFDVLVKQLHKHLQEQQIEIPDSSALSAAALAKKGGLLEAAYNYTSEHINIFKCLAEVVGGAFYFKAGLNQSNPRKTTAGAVIVSGWAAAMLIKEKKPDPEQLANAGAVQKAKAFIQEKPLRLAGWAGLTHNALSIWGALEERTRRPGTNFYQYDLAAISSMLVANSLYSISHKKSGGDITNNQLIQDVYGMAGQILLAQPEAAREAAIQVTADFLGKRAEIQETRSQIVQNLHQKIDELNKNPWVHRSAENSESFIQL